MAAKVDIDNLFRLYYRPMCLYAQHYISDADAVEDIVQEAFMSLWQNAQAGKIPLNPKAYLSTCVKNACIDILRQHTAHPVVSMSGVNESEIFFPNETEGKLSDEEALARVEQFAEIWKAINALPPGRRRMLLLHKRDGLSHAEIAERLGVSQGTVRNQISRALKSLRSKTRKRILYFFV